MSIESKKYELELETIFRKGSNQPPFSADEFAQNPKSTFESGLRHFEGLDIICAEDISYFMNFVSFNDNETVEQYIARNGNESLNKTINELKAKCKEFDQKINKSRGNFNYEIY